MIDRKRVVGHGGKAAKGMPLGIKLDIDAQLSRYASKHADAIRPEGKLSPDSSRTEYERDYHRILFSLAFRRLRHKTQVFYAPENDHVCTRMEHSLQVASIADTVCRNLSLNSDLANAIALGHDLGHAPFGHTGEKALKDLCTEEGLPPFTHEAHSLRVVDKMKELHGETLKLTYQVRDGIVCHCGEEHEMEIKPDKDKNLTSIDTTSAGGHQKPFTLEGCVVRYADRVAYLPVDLQDALELKVVKERNVPPGVRRILGIDSGEMIGRITEDIISSSKNQPFIATSKTIFESLTELYEFSKVRIYQCDHLKNQQVRITKLLKDLFNDLKAVYERTEQGQNQKLRKNFREKTYQVFFKFLDDMQYDEETPSAQPIIDFIAGMTDNFALKAYQEIFLSIPMPLMQ